MTVKPGNKGESRVPQALSKRTPAFVGVIADLAAEVCCPLGAKAANFRNN